METLPYPIDRANEKMILDFYHIPNDDSIKLEGLPHLSFHKHQTGLSPSQDIISDFLIEFDL